MRLPVCALGKGIGLVLNLKKGFAIPLLEGQTLFYFCKLCLIFPASGAKQAN